MLQFIGWFELLNTNLNCFMHQYDRGLGVTRVRNDQHEIDGLNDNEAVRVTFDQEVTLQTIYFSYVGKDDDFRYHVDSGLWSQGFDIVGGNKKDTAYGYYSFSLPGILGRVFDVRCCTAWTWLG